MGLTLTLFFWLTAMLGAWAAYDRRTAYVRFSLLTAGLFLALGLAWLGRSKVENTLAVVGLASISAAACLGLIFMCLPNVPSGPIANALAILLPLGLCSRVRIWKRPNWLPALLVSGSVAIAFVALILTMERTAWLALIVGILGAGAVFWRFAFSSRRSSRWLLKGFLASVGILLVGYLAILIHPTSLRFLKDLPLGPLAKRLPLWHDSLDLIQDYLFFGIGFGSTAMALSSYVYLLHVPFQDQAHNLFLEIAIEQGMPGLIAFLGMALTASGSLVSAFRWGDATVRLAATGTAASLGALLVYGMFDSEAYASPLIPVLFLPLGCSWLVEEGIQRPLGTARTPLRVRPRTVWSTMIPVLIVCSLMLIRGVRAQLIANMGALTQMQAELSVYSWPKWGIQDEVRRNPAIDLSGTVAAYQRALSLDSRNATANWRMGQIEIARGDYLSARRYLEAAHLRAPDQRATRQLLGEIYAISGNCEQAVNLWQTIDTSQAQLDVRSWFYESIGAKQELAHFREAMASLKRRG